MGVLQRGVRPRGVPVCDNYNDLWSRPTVFGANRFGDADPHVCAASPLQRNVVDVANFLGFPCLGVAGDKGDVLIRRADVLEDTADFCEPPR